MAPVIRTKLAEVAPEANKEGLRIVAAVGGAAVCGALSHPFDTVKTCMQGDVEQATYRSMRHSFRTIFGAGGVAALYRGIEFRFLRQVWQVWVLDLMREKLADVLFPPHTLTPRIKLELSGEAVRGNLA